MLRKLRCKYTKSRGELYDDSYDHDDFLIYRVEPYLPTYRDDCVISMPHEAGEWREVRNGLELAVHDKKG